MEIVLNIEGMKCDGCVNRVSNVLKNIKGVKEYKVSLEDKKIYLTVKNDKVVDEAIKKVEALDFEVTRED